VDASWASRARHKHGISTATFTPRAAAAGRRRSKDLNQALKLIKTLPLFEHAVGCLTEFAAGLRISAKFELNSRPGPAAASQLAAGSYY